MKIVIWGHYPLHSSTHSYIHGAYYKALKSMGFEVEWLPNQKIQDENYSDVIFFVEDSQKSYMPIREN